MYDIEIFVIGVGVVGFVVVRVLVVLGCEVMVLEWYDLIGLEISVCNFEVIYVGIYYFVGSFKVCLCVEGKKKFYVFCCENGVLYENIGKLIVVSIEVQFLDFENIW